MFEGRFHELLELARRSPSAQRLARSGKDPLGEERRSEAVQRVVEEHAELTDALDAGDALGMLAECADVAYYLAIAYHHDPTLLRLTLLSLVAPHARIAARWLGLSEAHVDSETCLALACAKYRTRLARGMKDEEAERAAVRSVLEGGA